MAFVDSERATVQANDCSHALFEWVCFGPVCYVKNL